MSHKIQSQGKRKIKFPHFGGQSKAGSDAAVSVSHAAVRAVGRSRPNFFALMEPLEGRTLMSTVVVNTNIDSLYPDGSGLTSIRNAVKIANSSTTPTTITFDPTVFATSQTITENGTQLELSNSSEPTTIIGPGAGVTLDADRKSRAIEIDSHVTVEIADLTISNAHTSGYDFYGAGINNSGTLNLIGCTLSGNVAADGGAVSSSGSATLVNDTFTGNSGYSPFGGGANNSAVSNSGTMTINDCTIVGNTSVGAAAGLGNSGTCDIANSIIAANTESSASEGDASGTFISYGYNLVGRTNGSSGWNGADLTGTTASPLDPGLAAISRNGGPTETFLPQTGSLVIASGSVAFVPSGVSTDQRGFARTYNGTVDIGAVEAESATAVTADTLQFDAQPLIANAGELNAVIVDVLGPSGTIDTSNDSNVTLTLTGGTSGATLGGTVTVTAVNGVATFSNLTVATGGTGFTLTATDGTLSPVQSSTFDNSDTNNIVVNSSSDTATGSGVVTLRDAIATANAATTPTTISFDPTVFASAQTITLDGTQLELTNTNEATTITGPSADVTVSANGASRVLEVDEDVSATISGVNIIDGNAPTSGNEDTGGGIFNDGTLTFENATVSGMPLTAVEVAGSIIRGRSLSQTCRSSITYLMGMGAE